MMAIRANAMHKCVLDRPLMKCYTGVIDNMGAKGFRPGVETHGCAPRLSGGLVKHLANLNMPTKHRHTQWQPKSAVASRSDLPVGWLVVKNKQAYPRQSLTFGTPGKAAKPSNEG